MVASGAPTANLLMPIPGTPLRISKQDPMLCLFWPSISGTNYSTLAFTNITESLTNWSVIPVGSTNRWYDMANLESETRFYRLRVEREQSA